MVGKAQVIVVGTVDVGGEGEAGGVTRGLNLDLRTSGGGVMPVLGPVWTSGVLDSVWGRRIEGWCIAGGLKGGTTGSKEMGGGCGTGGLEGDSALRSKIVGDFLRDSAVEVVLLTGLKRERVGKACAGGVVIERGVTVEGDVEGNTLSVTSGELGYGKARFAKGSIREGVSVLIAGVGGDAIKRLLCEMSEGEGIGWLAVTWEGDGVVLESGGEGVDVAVTLVEIGAVFEGEGSRLGTKRLLCEGAGVGVEGS